MSVLERDGLETNASSDAEVKVGAVGGTDGDVKDSRSKEPPNAATLRPEGSVRIVCFPE